jgi:hypothetical protein
MLARMLDNERDVPPQSPAEEPASEPPSADKQPNGTPSADTSYLPFVAYAPPSALVPPPPLRWTRTYELPTARSVVSAGLQLAVGSRNEIRRASIYIGLLSLGAFGPATILLLIGIARLLGDPATADTLTGANPSLLFFEQPELAGPLTFISVIASIGVVLLVAISIDAQAIAIALLGAAASESPLSLREAIKRARQAFWRLLWSGLIVGLLANVLSLVLALPFLRPADTNQGITFITSMIATLVVSPFAFAATGIVLGDAGALQTLRRSFRLFLARPRIALVVTLFTLVTSAIQLFAFSGGADIAYRIADFFHLGEGAVTLIVPGILVLAFIVAFGSLTFTIAAIVAAPQVAAFLGLTFYSAGLDDARENAASPARRARWVSAPMSVVIIGLAVIVAVGAPSIVGFQPRAASPVLGFLRNSIGSNGVFASPFGTPVVTVDPVGDQGVPEALDADIVVGDVAALYEIPSPLLDNAFACGDDGVACGDEGRGEPFDPDDGAILFAQRVAVAPALAAGRPHAEWGQMVRVKDQVAAPASAGRRFEGANVRFVTELDGGSLRLRQFNYKDGTWAEYFTSARSAWRDDLLVTLIPWENVPDEVTAWDVYSFVGLGRGAALDNIRAADGEIIELDVLPWINVFSFDLSSGPPS